MSQPSFRRVVALDGGTTNTRARLVEGDRVVATARRGVGVRDAIGDHGRRRLLLAVRDVVREVLAADGGGRPDAIVAAGMLSSELGLIHVPHVTAPAGIDDLARGARLGTIPEVDPGPIVVVPGVRTPAAPGHDGWMDADVMRGEECETLGAWDSVGTVRSPGAEPNDAPRAGRSEMTAFLWPGSHTKLVAVDQNGRITSSLTTLAGELMQAVAQETLLAASLPGEFPESPDPEALAAGARAAAVGIGRAAFLVRVAAIERVMDPPRRAAFWVGAMIGQDAEFLSRHPIFEHASRVFVGGREPQRTTYAGLLPESPGRRIVVLSEDEATNASARGSVAVARRHLARIGR